MRCIFLMSPALALCASFGRPCPCPGQQPVQLLPQTAPLFQEPSKDELRMTADPSAPGAAAVYLYRDDVTDEQSRTRSFSERIKVLTEKGKGLATIQMPYNPATEKLDIQARTIHADGTVIPMVDKPADIVDMKSKGFQLDTLVFTLPNVEVGSILEYRVTVRSNFFTENPTWMIQQAYFIHKAHYAFKAFGVQRLSYAEHIGSGGQGGPGRQRRLHAGPGRYSRPA